MTRATANPGRNLDEPFVPDESAGRAARFGAKLLRGYLTLVVIVGLLAGLVMIVFLLTIH